MKIKAGVYELYSKTLCIETEQNWQNLRTISLIFLWHYAPIASANTSFLFFPLQSIFCCSLWFVIRDSGTIQSLVPNSFVDKLSSFSSSAMRTIKKRNTPMVRTNVRKLLFCQILGRGKFGKFWIWQLWLRFFMVLLLQNAKASLKCHANRKLPIAKLQIVPVLNFRSSHVRPRRRRRRRPPLRGLLHWLWGVLWGAVVVVVDGGGHGSHGNLRLVQFAIWQLVICGLHL